MVGTAEWGAEALKVGKGTHVLHTQVDALRDVPVANNLVDEDGNGIGCDIGNNAGSPAKVVG